jgi:hypothetical protein
MATALEKHDTCKTSKAAIQACHHIRSWLAKPDTSFTEKYGYVPFSEASYSLSNCPTITDSAQDEEGDIVLIQQFYVAPAPERHAENVVCLRRNLANPHIDRITMLNERKYTDQELGLDAVAAKLARKKLVQIVTGERLTYSAVFDHAKTLGDSAFIVLANTDIFFDDSVANVRKCGLRYNRRVLAQLRHEYNGQSELSKCRLFGVKNGFAAAPHSQDAWIWHSAHAIPPELEEVFQMGLGTAGCDNRVLHWLGIAGFARFNLPLFVKAYHYHTSELRNHHKVSGENCKPPYHMLYPYYPMSGWLPNPSLTFDVVQDNAWLRGFIEAALKRGNVFMIPRLAGIENDVAALGAELEQTGRLPPNRKAALKAGLPRLKENAGVKLSNNDQVKHYARAYLGAFHSADAYFTWAPWGGVAKHWPVSYQFMESNFIKPKTDARVLDIFNTIRCGPWTRALKGKRILVVSAFVETIRTQIARKIRPYPIELFPDCSFVFIKPPQTQGANPALPFAEEFETFLEDVRKIKDDFDVALCSCGGYGNPLCGALKDMGKSAIYVGGVLQMYFGVYGRRWEKETPQMLNAYKHEGWVRPSLDERPTAHTDIEAGCYW